ncbi:MAG: polyketide synthase family protein [Bacteroidota bacterium]|nr:polyketide synthase family protein [Bacteroidota bacterium]
MTNEQMQEILQKSLIKIKSLEQELEQAKAGASVAQAHVPKKDPVVVIGTGVRLANNINSTSKLWKLIGDKKSAIGRIPKDRFDVDLIYDADANKAGKTNSMYGAFLENDIRAFDAEFFSISPREAKSIDPSQRMILEVVYEAFERAGIATDKLKASNTGVYIALGNCDYISARFRSGNLETVDLYDTTGIFFGTAGGRVSFLYDFQGTSYNVDAACASTILAVHLAKEDLQKKVIDLAVVSSANLLLTPEAYVGLSKLGSLSSTDQCKAFSDDADGYVRGEGCGVVLLKRLSDAERDNDNIELHIIGSSVKHNGSSNGFTAPNPEVISNTIKDAIKEANIDVNDVDFVEAHGIGNRFTDAVEVQSIHEGYKGRNKPVYVGSVKANIGHLEAGTGMPMLFKVIEAIKHKTIPPQININGLNSDVEWDKINSRIATEALDWTRDDGKPLRAAINLSGYSGTNVHMIFEAPKPKKASDEIKGPYHFVISAKNAASLKLLAQKYIDEMEEFGNCTLTEMCYTLQKGRNHFDHSLSIIAHHKQDITEGLTAFLQEEKTGKYVLSDPELYRNTEVAFLFTGQGAQYFGMCRGYYENFEIFKAIVDECETMLKPYLEYSIKDILWNETIDKNLIHQTKYTQPALFVVEYALSKLWMQFGVRPSVLIGHSIGEIVALTVAKAISLPDALKLVIARAALMNSLPQNEGSMASVFCNEEALKPFLQDANVDLASINSLKNCTVSGRKEDIANFVEKLKEHNIRAVALNVSHAFHSRLMEPILNKFIAFAGQTTFRQPEIPVISNLTGKEITKEELSADYFARHIRNAVQFSDGIEYLQKGLNVEVYLEVGPNPVLISLAKQTNTNANTLWLASARKDIEDATYFHETLRQLYCAGIAIHWDQLYIGKKINRVQLPTYAWNWKVHWEDPVFGNQFTVHSSQFTKEKKQKSREPSTVNGEPNKKATRDTLLAYLQLEAAKVLGLEAGQKVDIHKPYREQGFDSMMSGEFLGLMEKHIGAELKMDIIYQYNTPKDLHQYLIDTYFGGGSIDTSQAITIADIMFNQEMEAVHTGDWHEIKPHDNVLMKWFKKFDKHIPTIKNQ